MPSDVVMIGQYVSIPRIQNADEDECPDTETSCSKKRWPGASSSGPWS